MTGVDEVFGRYRLRGLLGAGGMGHVYRAYDTELDREVAIKVLPAQDGTDDGFVERFRREARIAAKLDEPHVVPIYDSGQVDGRLFIAMRLIDGTDIAAMLAERGPMPAYYAVALISQAATALDAAHDAGLVHRDVKPANLLVTAKSFLYLIDFGIARGASATQLTGTGAAIGTLAYMAPERFTTGVTDKSADIYALACVLHECLTGAKPFPDVSVEQQMFAHIQADRPRASTLVAGIPTGFDEVIATGMAVDPQRRYPTASALAHAAQQALHSPVGVPVAVQAQPSPATALPAMPDHVAAAAPTVLSARTRMKRFRRLARTTLLTTTAIAVLALVGGLIYWFIEPPTITVGKTPYGIAIDSNTHTAYVVNNGDNTVSVIDTTTNTVTKTIPVGDHPGQITIDPGIHIAYVSTLQGISVIDTTTNTVTTTISAVEDASSVAVVPGSSTLYVATFTRGTALIDITTNAVIKPVKLDGTVEGMAVDHTTHTLYAGVYHSNTDETFTGAVSVIDAATGAITATIPTGEFPTSLAINPATHTVYATDGSSTHVFVIDTTTNTVSSVISVGNNPCGLVLDSDSHTAYVSNAKDRTISVIDTTTNAVTRTIPVRMPLHAWYTTLTSRYAAPHSSCNLGLDTGSHTLYMNSNVDRTVSMLRL